MAESSRWSEPREPDGSAYMLVSCSRKESSETGRWRTGRRMAGYRASTRGVEAGSTSPVLPSVGWAFPEKNHCNGRQWPLAEEDNGEEIVAEANKGFSINSVVRSSA